jgi:iron(III) transport system substrate-binding protein
MLKRLILVVMALGLMIAPATFAQDDDGEEDPGVLNIYSARHYGAMEGMFVAFEEETGIEVRVSAGTPRDLLSRLSADIERGGRSVADLFLAIDAGVLDLAVEQDLLQPLSADEVPALFENIPEEYRDPDGHWFGLSIRARVLVFNPANVTEDEIAELNTYSDLAADTWEDRVCMRPASHIYTVSLLSSLVYHLGEEEAVDVFDGIAENVTRYINSDTSQIRAVAAGECDVAFVNHYYVGRLTASEDPADQDTVESIEVKFMNQETTGNFFNVNAAGVVTGARNYDNAVRFIEYMSSVEAQGPEADDFPGGNFEYPTNPEAEIGEEIDFGEFTLDTTYALWEYGDLQQRTVELLEEIGFGFTEN